jgi:hypothetical protein
MRFFFQAYLQGYRKSSAKRGGGFDFGVTIQYGSYINRRSSFFCDVCAGRYEGLYQEENTD